ncbi:MAG: aminoglycoside phosphotransferase family protein, partial [Nanoarchaeota archaeon]|nr:aminoglycoside phosphotransferase family protein [Nanoarchaeota archaeon]
SIAKALSSIHSIHWNSQKEEVFVHGDFHPENILIENKKEEDVVIEVLSLKMNIFINLELILILW